MDIFKTFQFESSHRLPNVRPGHKCARMHGHSYRVTVTVSGEIGSVSGWVCDFADLATAWVPLNQALDHRTLNDVEGLENPTSEHLAIWIWEHLIGTLPNLSEVKVSETCSSGCIYRGPARP